jgi:acetyltransferase-like isoleucine patch superfamily enzyme
MIYKKITGFLRASLSVKIHKLRRLYYHLIGWTYYRRLFNHFGGGSLIFSPLNIANPEHISIGKHVHIGHSARIEAFTGWHGGQQFSPELEIQDGVSIGQNFTVGCANKVVIGRNTVISFDVFITDNDHAYEQIGVPVMEQPLIVQKTIIGENCFIASGVKILAGTVLGKQCIVGSNSVVRGEFPDYCVIVGAPARMVKRYSAQSGCWERV